MDFIGSHQHKAQQTIPSSRMLHGMGIFYLITRCALNVAMFHLIGVNKLNSPYMEYVGLVDWN